MAENFQKLEDFVVEALSKEIAEFQKDKQDVAETKVRLIREAKAHFEKVRNNFVKKGASKVSEVVGKTLQKEISSLKDDIEAARKNDFGRRLFESYAQEYTQSFLNEKGETAKLLKVVDMAKLQAEEAKKTADESKKQIEAKEKEIVTIKEAAEREKVINELISPLNTEQKEIMNNLLESVQTGALRKQFEKYIPSVLNGRTPAKKQAINEGTEVTGDKQTNIVNGSQFNSNIVDIRRLAGI
jgi:polyhydroxyalkanoate synthesis regulator phasin